MRLWVETDLSEVAVVCFSHCLNDLKISITICLVVGEKLRGLTILLQIPHETHFLKLCRCALQIMMGETTALSRSSRLLRGQMVQSINASLRHTDRQAGCREVHCTVRPGQIWLRDSNEVENMRIIIGRRVT